MSNDEPTNILLDEYVETAKRLQGGVNITPETMARYHGMTGQLLAHALRSLWTQEQLDRKIAEAASKLVCNHMAECSALRQKETRATQTLRGVLVGNFRFILVCVTIILTAWGFKSTAKTIVETTGIVQAVE
jgi:hypothetical protein